MRISPASLAISFCGVLALLGASPAAARSARMHFPGTLVDAKLIVFGEVHEWEYDSTSGRIRDWRDGIRVHVTETLKGGELAGQWVMLKIPYWARQQFRDRVTRGSRWMFITNDRDEVICLGKEEGDAQYKLEVPLDEGGVICVADPDASLHFVVPDNDWAQILVDRKALRAFLRQPLHIDISFGAEALQPGTRKAVVATVVIRNTGDRPLTLAWGPAPLPQLRAAFRLVFFSDINAAGRTPEQPEYDAVRLEPVMGRSLWYGTLGYEQAVDLSALLRQPGKDKDDGFLTVPAGGGQRFQVDLGAPIADLLRGTKATDFPLLGVSFEFTGARWRTEARSDLFRGYCSSKQVLLRIRQ